MDKVKKILLKSSKSFRKFIRRMVYDFKIGNLKDYDVKKLKGRKDIYRVRKGVMRIIILHNDKEIKILGIEHRATGTYKDKS